MNRRENASEVAGWGQEESHSGVKRVPARRAKCVGYRNHSGPDQKCYRSKCQLPPDPHWPKATATVTAATATETSSPSVSAAANATKCLDKPKQRLNQAGINAVQSLISKFGFSNMDSSTTDLIQTLCLAILKESELDVNKSYFKIVDAKNSKSIYSLRNTRNMTAFEHRSFSGPCVYCHPLEFGQTLNINNKRTDPNSINVILNRTAERDAPPSRNFNPHFIYGGEPSFATSLGQYAGEPSFTTSLGQYGGEPSFTTSLGQFAFGRM